MTELIVLSLCNFHIFFRFLLTIPNLLCLRFMIIVLSTKTKGSKKNLEK